MPEKTTQTDIKKGTQPQDLQHTETTAKHETTLGVLWRAKKKRLVFGLLLLVASVLIFSLAASLSPWLIAAAVSGLAIGVGIIGKTIYDAKQEANKINQDKKNTKDGADVEKSTPAPEKELDALKKQQTEMMSVIDKQKETIEKQTEHIKELQQKKNTKKDTDNKTDDEDKTPPKLNINNIKDIKEEIKKDLLNEQLAERVKNLEARVQTPTTPVYYAQPGYYYRY